MKSIIGQFHNHTRDPREQGTKQQGVNYGYKIAVKLLEIVCLQDLYVATCKMLGDWHVVMVEHSELMACMGTSSSVAVIPDLFPDRVWTQSIRVSPGFKRRSPILRGHCLPGLLCSRSQRLAQYAEREYAGKSVMRMASLRQHWSQVFNSLSHVSL